MKRYPLEQRRAAHARYVARQIERARTETGPVRDNEDVSVVPSGTPARGEHPMLRAEAVTSSEHYPL